MDKKTNRLAKESSPYLQQHAQNPVDWYPWGTEALDKARRDKRPIFLSIGYSACHWCHVMEHESFEDEATAEILNREFVCIKVDREERPDIDHIYMSAVQALTQHGGWPLSVFLTPELQPFYGGTYFPPEDRHGMPSFKRVLTGVAQAWKTRREEVTQNATALTAALKDLQTGTGGLPAGQSLSLDLVDAAVEAIGRSFDSNFGGLGSAPKFFHAMSFRLCLRHWKRTANPAALKLVTFTLEKLAAGGIRDQLGGGFHRYSTDAQWLAPHFEKMLYDNALLAELYLEAYQATGDSALARIARSTLDYVLREMTAPEGGFYSTQDADSEGEEGKFYVWSHPQVMATLGDELGKLFCAVYDITPEGNWEGHNIPRRKFPLEHFAQSHQMELVALEDELGVASRKLLAERSQRIWPGRDEKILLSWNGLMLAAFALGYQVLRDNRYLEAAQKNAAFLFETFTAQTPLASGKRRLYHAHKDGSTRFNGYLDDYAFFLNGLIALYECDFQTKWIDAALEVADGLIEQFWDAEAQAFFFTGQDHETLITRPKEVQDGATPAGQSIAVTALIRLARLTGKTHYEDIAVAALSQLEPVLRVIPTGMSQMLIGLEMALAPSEEVVLVPGSDSDEYEEALALLGGTFSPHRVIAGPSPDGKLTPLLQGRSPSGELTLYVCRAHACDAPIVGAQAVLKEIKQWKQPSKA
jgi:uncharacterized protein